jgi:hypothetical protein
MTTWLVRIVAVSVMASGIGALGAAQAGGGANDAVANEVAAALKEYHRLFSSKQADVMAERAYGAPLTTLGRNTYTVLQTRQDVEAWARPFVTRLVADGWDRSEMPSPSICVLTPTSAIASGEFVRYRKDGSVLSRLGNAYVFSKGAEGWRVVAMLSHDAAKPIRCDR